jgi:hypothetical protein
MVASSATAGNFAKKSGGILCAQNAESVQLTTAISERAKAIFDKPYRALVDILNISERDAHYRLASERKYTAGDIAKLLQSEEGIQFLIVLMEQARPRWWKAVLKMGVLGSIEQRRQAELKLMRRVFDADDTTASQFSNSFRAQDPDYFSVVLEGYDASTALGADRGSVAPSKGRRR